MANAAGADLVVHLHCDGFGDSRVHGVRTLYPETNRWTRSIARASMRAARSLQSSLVGTTHARNRGIASRGDLTGFNWSKAPTVLVEMGFLSNRLEDRLLGSGVYREKTAYGLSAGIVRFLKSDAR
jgi:N-acetylmuramoyl-L-alanine amidase